MKIGAIQSVTLIDFPGKVAATVFTAGCNLNCSFCHNPDLIKYKGDKKIIQANEEIFFKFLSGRKDLLDGICITGGEPTVQSDLTKFIKKIKNEGMAVKLDTNGNKPTVLKKIFKEGLIDYIAMDIKSSPTRYVSFCGNGVDTKNIKESAKLIMQSGVDYEFRTTVVPGIIDINEIKKIGRWLNGSQNYYLQQFVKENACDKSWEKVTLFSDKELKEMAKIAEKYFKKVAIRGI